MGEPTRVHNRGCGAGPDRGPGRESRRRRDVPSVRQFRQHLWPPGLVHRDGQFGLQQRLRRGNDEVHHDQCPGAPRLQPKRIPVRQPIGRDYRARPTALAIRSRCGLRRPSRARGLASTRATFPLVRCFLVMCPEFFSALPARLSATFPTPRYSPPVAAANNRPAAANNRPAAPTTPAAVPELSTWAMMLLGLAGLGLAAKRRRAIGLPGRKSLGRSGGSGARSSARFDLIARFPL